MVALHTEEGVERDRSADTAEEHYGAEREEVKRSDILPGHRCPTAVVDHTPQGVDDDGCNYCGHAGKTHALSPAAVYPASTDLSSPPAGDSYPVPGALRSAPAHPRRDVSTCG